MQIDFEGDGARLKLGHVVVGDGDETIPGFRYDAIARSPRRAFFFSVGKLDHHGVTASTSGNMLPLAAMKHKYGFAINVVKIAACAGNAAVKMQTLWGCGASIACGHNSHEDKRVKE